MIGVRRAAIVGCVLLFCGAGGTASASAVSDFQARLAQTTWNLQAVETILRSQPLSAVAVPMPEALGSYLALLSENVSALAAFPSARVTDEQRKTMAEGLKGAATQLKDFTALANNRGLTAVSSALSVLEANCRAAISAL